MADNSNKVEFSGVHTKSIKDKNKTRKKTFLMIVKSIYIYYMYIESDMKKKIWKSFVVSFSSNFGISIYIYIRFIHAS